MGGRPSRFCFRPKLVSWTLGTAAFLALTGTAHAAAEIRIEPTTLYFGAAGPASASSGASARPAEVSESLPAPGIRPEAVGALREKAKNQRSVRVLARLAVPFIPEGRQSSSQGVRDQRLAIDRVQDSVLKRLEKERVKLNARFEHIPFLALEVDAKALDLLAAMAEVNGIEEDVFDKATLVSSTAVIGSGVAWASGWTGDGQVVAVLDTGVDKTHPFFSSGTGNKVVSEACYSSNVTNSTTSVCPGGVQESIAPGSGAPCDDYYGDCVHGTHVAGIAAGNNGTGPGFGVARGADLIAVQVFSLGCGGYCIGAWVSDQIKGLERVYNLADEFDIAAVNMSLGGGYYSSRSACDADNTARKAAIDNLRSIDVATVAASGNDGNSFGIGAPACISSTIGVGATNDDDSVAYFSNLAPFLDLLAPGASVESSVPGGGTAILNGTSMAAPHVAGAWAVLKQASPGATVSSVLERLRATAVRTGRAAPDLYRINLARAIGAPLESEEFTITNDGTTVLSILSMQLQAHVPWIRWSPEAPFDIPPGGTKTIKVSVDFGGAPDGISSNQLIVASTDADESPYPGAVFLTIDKQPCHVLTRTHAGPGGNAAPGLDYSPGCPLGAYHAGQLIPLTAQPAIGSDVLAWSGTDNDGSVSLANSMTMPAAPHTVSVTYFAQCYALTLSHTGSGSDPVALPASSPGCPAGQYKYAEPIQLTAAPAPGWRVGSWTNTSKDTSIAKTNSLIMPASARTVSVTYLEGLPSLLLVDNDPDFFDYRSYYTAALDSLGVIYHVWDIAVDGQPTLADLAQYPRVTWHGYQYSAVLDDAKEALLASYLDQGGRLFFAAQDYLDYRGLTPFAANYLGVGSFQNDIEPFTVQGEGSAFSGLGPFSLGYPSYYYGDSVSPGPGAEVAFQALDAYYGPGPVGVSKIGPNYRTIFLGFQFESLPTAQARRDVMGAALEYLSTVFVDVPRGYWAKKWIESLFYNGVTMGCSANPRQYCPGDPMTREQMAIFLLLSKEPPGYTPPPCTVPPFNDVPVSHSLCPWIQELVRRGVTSGCGGGNYCPDTVVTRNQMAVFLLSTLEGPGYAPTPCGASTTFLDVPASSPFCPWVQELARRGITGGCGGGSFCPGDPVNRAQMAVFLVTNFRLPLF